MNELKVEVLENTVLMLIACCQDDEMMKGFIESVEKSFDGHEKKEEIDVILDGFRNKAKEIQVLLLRNE